jgi:poly(A) polymerase Pap1
LFVDQPFTKFFDHQMKTDERSNAEERLYKSFFFIALRFSPSTEKVNLKHFTSEFLHKVNYWDGRKAGMDLHIMHVLQADLPAFVINDTAEGQAAYLPSAIAVLDESNTNSTPPTKRLRVSSD